MESPKVRKVSHWLSKLGIRDDDPKDLPRDELVSKISESAPVVLTPPKTNMKPTKLMVWVDVFPKNYSEPNIYHVTQYLNKNPNP